MLVTLSVCVSKSRCSDPSCSQHVFFTKPILPKTFKSDIFCLPMFFPLRQHSEKKVSIMLQYFEFPPEIERRQKYVYHFL